MKIGDKVVLNSGGPIMTITDVRETVDGPLYTCTWIHDGSAHEIELSPECLRGEVK